MAAGLYRGRGHERRVYLRPLPYAASCLRALTAIAFRIAKAG